MNTTMSLLDEKIRKLNVLVVGDLILDEYLFSKVNRISPEAPVPVALVEKKEYRLGGASNVALNVKSLGANVTLFGLVGKDEASNKLKSIISSYGIGFVGFSPKKYRTIVKTRVVSNGNHLIRIDVEDSNVVLEKQDIEMIKKILIKKIQKSDMIIISDYNKGVVSQELINFLVSSKKSVYIDAKKVYKRMDGLRLIKPNFSEAKNIAMNLGMNLDFKNTDEDVEKMGAFIRSKINTNLLITRSEMGASFIGKNEICHDRTKSSQILDITGAGDTCISIFSILDYLDFPKKESLDIMNKAAKVTVSHLGTYFPTLKEIFNEESDVDYQKFLVSSTLSSKISELKKQNKRIVFTNGCFDLLHRGHISYLNNAKKLGDILIIGLNSDDSVKRLKGKSRPIIDEESRAYVLCHLDCVDYVVIFHEDIPLKLIDIVKPDVYVKGGDYKKEDLPETKIVEKYGGKVKILNFVDGFSTSKIVDKIKNE